MVDNIITGRAKKYDGTAIDYVSIFSWANGRCIAQVVPDASGNWSYSYSETMEVGISYIAEGCEPVTHGKYRFEALGDPLANKVEALLHFDDGITDKTSRFWQYYSYGNSGICAVSSNNPKFGFGALQHTGRDKAVITDSFVSSTQDLFTIEMFVYLDDLDGVIYDRHIILSQSVTGANSEQMISIGLDGSKDKGKLVFFTGAAHNLGERTIKSTNPCVQAQTWTHIAICFDGTTIKGFSDGVKVIDVPASFGWNPTTKKVMLGLALVEGSEMHRQGLNGNIDELRITKGVARYSDNFTPPESPFPF